MIPPWDWRPCLRIRRELIGALIVAILLSGCGSGGDDDTATPPTRADLTVSDAAMASPAQPRAGETAVITATVANRGAMAAGPSTWEVARDGVTGWRRGTLPGLEVAASTPLSFTVHETAGGRHTYVLTVDGSNAIGEADEGNNQTTIALDFSAAPIDLRLVPPLAVWPRSPITGEVLSLNVLVDNASPNAGAATNVAWSLARDGIDGYQRGVITTITPGMPVSITIPLPPESAGAHVYRFTVDPTAAVDDPIRANNVAEISVMVMPAASA